MPTSLPQSSPTPAPSTARRLFTAWLGFQAVVDAGVALVLFIAPVPAVELVGIVPLAHPLFLRFVALVTFALALGYGLVALAPTERPALLFATNTLRAATAVVLLVSVAFDSTLHPLLRSQPLGELGFLAATLFLQHRAAVGFGPGPPAEKTTP